MLSAPRPILTGHRALRNSKTFTDGLRADDGVNDIPVQFGRRESRTPMVPSLAAAYNWSCPPGSTNRACLDSPRLIFRLPASRPPLTKSHRSTARASLRHEAFNWQHRPRMWTPRARLRRNRGSPVGSRFGRSDVSGTHASRVD
jgi:hypothetical protein